MPAKNKVLKQLDTVLLVRDKPAASTPYIDAFVVAKVAGDTVINVSSVVNLAVGDIVRIGEGEEMEIGVVSIVGAGNFTLANGLTYAHPAATVIVEQVAYDLGNISDGGITVSGNAPSTDMLVANRRMPLTTLAGYADLAAEFGLAGVTLYNLCVALGLDYATVKGTGAAVTPFSLATSGSDYGSVQNQSIIAMGTLMDGSTVRVELWGVDADFSSLSLSVVRGAAAVVPCRMVAAAGGVITTGASAYVGASTFTAGKGDVLDSLSEVGLFLDETVAPLSTVLSAPGAAGATTVTTGAAATFGAKVGSWVRINTGENVEIHQVQSHAANALTLRTPLLRAHLTGTDVVLLAETPFAGVSEAGCALEVSGQLDAIRVATRRLGAGMKPGSASSVIRFAVIDFTLASFARALGIAATQIVSGRLPITASNIAMETVFGVYLKGILQGGRTARIHAWGCSQDVSAFAATLATQGIQTLPLAFKPSSALHFLNHA